MEPVDVVYKVVKETIFQPRFRSLSPVQGGVLYYDLFHKTVAFPKSIGIFCFRDIEVAKKYAYFNVAQNEIKLLKCIALERVYPLRLRASTGLTLSAVLADPDRFLTESVEDGVHATMSIIPVAVYVG